MALRVECSTGSMRLASADAAAHAVFPSVSFMNAVSMSIASGWNMRMRAAERVDRVEQILDRELILADLHREPVGLLLDARHVRQRADAGDQLGRRIRELEVHRAPQAERAVDVVAANRSPPSRPPR